ncbi:polyadenylation and cleavage factor [Canna indica]|uniref:Polyadenylation and cleavage factor n=1 Tax=Canna indica TaxID=4628 RepID=A0AAQ3KU18_9LILI|nr:polyadenylation and cleavage factor [Canna indica]
MELERLPSARENPRATQDRSSRPARAAAAPISERFNLMIRERAEELRETGGKDSTPTAYDVVRCYEEVLSELTLNSKPIITELTVIAGQQIQYAAEIVDAICARVLEVPVDQKLTILYLIDSIVKNVGQQYARTFATQLPKVFCEAYYEVHPTQHPLMHRLFGTWAQVFPSSVLKKIEDELQFSSSENQRPTELMVTRPAKPISPRPSHAINENPKHFNACGQYEQSAVGMLHSRVSSTFEVYDQKPYTQSECNLDQPELLPQQLATAGQGRLQTAMVHASSVTGARGLMPFPKNETSLPSSPPRVGLRKPLSPPNMSSHNGTSIKIGGRASPCHPGRSNGPNVWLDHSWSSNGDPRRGEASIPYNTKHVNGKQHARDLIDAYGNPGGTVSSCDKFPKVPRLHVNDTASEASARIWKNSDVDDYAWENMSPTLADRRNCLPPCGSNSGSFATLASISRSNFSALELNFQRHSWPVQTQLHAADDPSFMVRDRILGLESHPQSMLRHSVGKACQIEALSHQHKSSHIQDSGKNYMFSHSIQQNLRPVSHGRAAQKPVTFGGMTPLQSLSSAHADPLNMDTSMNQGTHRPMFMPDQQYTDVNQSGFPHLNQQSQGQQIPLSIESPYTLANILPPALTQVSSRSVGQPMNHLQTFHGVDMASVLSSSPFSMPSLTVYSTTDPSLQLHNRPLPPLPAGPPPASLQMGLASENVVSSVSTSPANAFSGLISSLMERGFISLELPAQPQVSLGTEFNMELLKERNESAISALYSDLPRQCTTCGLRFKSQEEHSSHMDWHVTKNRMSKTRKQKPSRNWYVTAKEWLNVAEKLGNDVVPGVLATELVVEKTEEKDMAVPADDNQNTCALCGEPFEDFYSDEMEEWMYKGAVYLNAPNGYIEGLERSQLGPIVHAKCRPDHNERSGRL